MITISLVTIQRFYIVIDHIPHAVHFISMAHLFCSWKFVPLNLPHLFLSFPISSFLSTTYLCSVSITLFLFLLCLFIFLESTYKWNHTVLSFSVRLISLSMVPSRSILVITNGKISFFFMANIPLCMYTTSSLSIHLLMGT